MDLLTVKLILIGIIILATLFFGVLTPLIMQRTTVCSRTGHTSGQNFQTVLKSFLNCFVGGVFLGTTLLHMLPEAQEKFVSIQKKIDISDSFPLPETIIGAGFFMIFFVEIIMMIVFSPAREQDNLQVTVSPQQHNEIRSLHQPSSSSGIYGTNGYTSIQPSDLEEQQQCRSQIQCEHRIEEQGLVSEQHPKVNSHSHDLLEQHINGFRSVVLLLALCIHTIFEGLAIGLLVNKTAVWSLAGAITAHKTIISLSLGSKILQTSDKIWKFFIFMIIFTITCPVGIFIGILVTSTDDKDSQQTGIASAVLGALATGTFLYITFFEFLNKEALENRSLIKGMLILAGFSTMVALTFLEL